MSNRLSENSRGLIRNSKLSIRATAAEWGVSPSTVQRWKERQSFDDRPRRPKGSGGVSQGEDVIFRELLKLSRYRYQHLSQYLRPLRMVLRSSARREHGKSGAGYDAGGPSGIAGNWGEAAYYRYLYNQCGGAFLKVFDRSKPRFLSVATHSIRVAWMDKSGKQVNGKLLLFMERRSGLLYIKACTTRIRPRTFALALSRFDQMFAGDMRALSFVSFHLEQDMRLNPPVSSVLQLQAGKPATATSHPDGSTGLSAKSKSRLNRHIHWNGRQKLHLSLDAVSPPQQGRLLIPGTYLNRKELDHFLERLANIINLKKRFYLHRGQRIPIAPVDRLCAGMIGSSRSDLKKSILLPLRPRYLWSSSG